MAKIITEQGVFEPEAYVQRHIDSDSKEERNIADWIHQWISGNGTFTLHTSGSTGDPKPISFDRKALAASARLTAKTFELKSGVSALLCLPISYVAGKMMIVRALVNDWHLHIVPPSSTVSLPKGVSIDFAAMTPMQVASTLDQQWLAIVKLIIGGAPLSDRLRQRLLQIHTECFETYGMTETLTHVAVKHIRPPLGEQRFHALEGVSISKDERDCLVVRAPHISPESVITHDIVELHNDGTFELLGRVDHVINSGGIKLFPEYIEKNLAKLLDLPFYIGKEPDPKLGERAVLHIEGQIWAKEDRIAWLEKARSVLPGTHMPKAIYFHHRFERTESGKIKR